MKYDDKAIEYYYQQALDTGKSFKIRADKNGNVVIGAPLKGQGTARQKNDKNLIATKQGAGNNKAILRQKGSQNLISIDQAAFTGTKGYGNFAKVSQVPFGKEISLGNRATIRQGYNAILGEGYNTKYAVVQNRANIYQKGGKFNEATISQENGGYTDRGNNAFITLKQTNKARSLDNNKATISQAGGGVSAGIYQEDGDKNNYAITQGFAAGVAGITGIRSSNNTIKITQSNDNNQEGYFLHITNVMRAAAAVYEGTNNSLTINQNGASNDGNLMVDGYVGWYTRGKTSLYRHMLPIGFFVSGSNNTVSIDQDNKTMYVGDGAETNGGVVGSNNTVTILQSTAGLTQNVIQGSRNTVYSDNASYDIFGDDNKVKEKNSLVTIGDSFYKLNSSLNTVDSTGASIAINGTRNNVQANGFGEVFIARGESNNVNIDNQGGGNSATYVNGKNNSIVFTQTIPQSSVGAHLPMPSLDSAAHLRKSEAFTVIGSDNNITVNQLSPKSATNPSYLGAPNVQGAVLGSNNKVNVTQESGPNESVSNIIGSKNTVTIKQNNTATANTATRSSLINHAEVNLASDSVSVRPYINSGTDDVNHEADVDNETATITQNGIHNFASIISGKVNGENGFNVASITQNGEDGWARINVYGHHNKASIEDSGIKNSLWIEQRGGFNKASINAGGSENFVHLAQNGGNYNTASIDVNGTQNNVNVLQLNDHNTAAITVNGDGNKLTYHQSLGDTAGPITFTGKNQKIDVYRSPGHDTTTTTTIQPVVNPVVNPTNEMPGSIIDLLRGGGVSLKK